MIVDRFIPIVGLEAIPIFSRLCRDFKYAVIPYYEVYFAGNVVRDLLEECSNTNLILSSIMPDHFLNDPDTIKLFHSFASEIGFKYVIAWDLPTYLDDYDRSRLNTEKAISYIDRFRRDFNVIPLIKGAYPEHIEYSCSEIYDMGFESAAFHISEYLYSRRRPWPYIKDYSLTGYGYMLHLLKTILEYPFKEVILLGGASPRYYRELIELDERIRLAGYSWYIDGVNYQLYSPEEKIISLRDRYYTCNCKVCRLQPVSRLRNRKSISLHNLLINKYLVEEMDDDLSNISIEVYDLILDTHEDLMVMNELRVGIKSSLWRDAVKLVRRYKPKYLILTGSLLSLDVSSLPDEYRDLVEALTEVEEDTRIFYIPGYISKSRWVKDTLYRLYLRDIDIVNRKMGISDKENILERLTRLILTAKKRMIIKKYTWDKPFTIEVTLYGSQEKSFETAVEELKMMNKECDWLFTNYINKPYIDYENKVATPGEWHREWDKYEEPEAGAIYVTPEGEVKLIRFKGD